MTVAASILTLIGAALSMPAQTPTGGTITGVVLDGSGRPVPDGASLRTVESRLS